MYTNELKINNPTHAHPPTLSHTHSMSQNASRSTKGGGPPPPASGKVFQKQGVDGSNAKYSQNNNTFNNKSTKLLNNATTNTTTNNTNGSLDENHNQQQHTDKNGTVAQPLVILSCFFCELRLLILKFNLKNLCFS